MTFLLKVTSLGIHLNFKDMIADLAFPNIAKVFKDLADIDVYEPELLGSGKSFL